MRAIKWMFFNGTMVACVWFGLVEGVTGALNVGLVLAWLTIMMGFFLLSNDLADEVIRKHGGISVPVPLSWASDIAITGILAWHGWLWTAGIFLFASFIFHGAISQARERAANQGVV